MERRGEERREEEGEVELSWVVRGVGESPKVTLGLRKGVK